MTKAPGLLLLCCWLLAGGCDKRPTPEQQSELARQTKPVRAFEAGLAKMLKAVPKEPRACPEAPIRGTIARTQNRRVLFADAQSLKLAAQGKPIDDASPLAFLVSPALRKRPASSGVDDPKSATDAAFAVVSLKKAYDFLAILESTYKAPRAEGKGFHGGKLRGNLALFDLANEKPLCSAPVFADSSQEAVKKPGQSLQEAATQDIQMQIRRALEETFTQMTNEVVLDLP